MQTLSTKRLLLREATDNDAQFLLTLMNDSGYLRMIGDRQVRTMEDAKQYLRIAPIYSYGPAGLGFNIVVLHANNEPIGICGLVKRDTLDDVDIGYAILEAHSGNGYATEAAAAVLAYAKDALGLSRLVAITDPVNGASKRVLEKIGLRFEKEIEMPSYPSKTSLYAYVETESFHLKAL